MAEKLFFGRSQRLIIRILLDYHPLMFFPLKGVDGAGKSTQIERFCDWLRTLGHKVCECRDPGSTPLGESIRQLLLAKDAVAIGRRSEMLLYMAARAQLVEEQIVPALAAGRVIVSDEIRRSGLNGT